MHKYSSPLKGIIIGLHLCLVHGITLPQYVVINQRNVKLATNPMTDALAPAIIVAMASDHAGFAMKLWLKQQLQDEGFTILDLGTDNEQSVDYPDYGLALAKAVIEKRAHYGIAICGSGIGISIAANRVAGIRAALCHEGYSAQLARRHNDANVLALGARLIGNDVAKDCALRFLKTAFEGGRHSKRIEKLG